MAPPERSLWERTKDVLARSDRLRAAWRRLRWGAVGSFETLPAETAVRMAYNVLLHREPDDTGAESFVTRLDSGQMRARDLPQWLMGSEEFHRLAHFAELGPSLHLSRCQFIRSLPRASRILDLGGTHLHRDVGAMVAMGYPYSFDELVIVDLPHDERHPLYQAGGALDAVETHAGPVRYRYHSMADLSDYPDDHFDLVYSGQTIEHVTEDDADLVLKQAARVLRPGGHLAVDTPNGRATRLQQAEFIDPDHKVEYTHGQLSQKLADAGFEIVEAKGLNYLGRSLAEGTFSDAEAAGNQGLYADLEDCYLLAYVARLPA